MSRSPAPISQFPAAGDTAGSGKFKRGDMPYVKISGELVFVLDVAGNNVDVRRASLTPNDFYQYRKDTFSADELETAQEREQRLADLKARGL